MKIFKPWIQCNGSYLPYCVLLFISDLFLKVMSPKLLCRSIRTVDLKIAEVNGALNCSILIQTHL